VNTSQSATLVRPVSLSLFDRKPFYTLLAATGFLLLVGAGLIMLTMGLIGGDLAETGVFALIFLVPGLLGVLLAWKVGRWGLIVPGLLALAMLVMFAPFLGFSLAHPEGGLEFIMVVLFVAGALLGVIGSGVSVFQWLRRATQAGATPAQRLAFKVILGLVLALALVSLTLTALARTSLAADVRASATPITIRHGAYPLSPLQVPAEGSVRLAVRNDDAVLHTFTLPEAGVDVSIPPGAERLIEFEAPAAGRYTWFCVPHSADSGTGREGMVGTLVVGP
jgi:heme/copper-type cytochrome/quinol oxidase subunit 2